jgi:hypothetical protein
MPRSSVPFGLVALSALAALTALAAPEARAALPERLSQTGLAEAAAVRAFEPRFPLWSDGAAKRRWIALPPGTAVDASRPDAWRFPAGTRLWKEFSVDGRPVETRHYVLGADGRWEFASYVWEGGDAVRAPAAGVTLRLPGGKAYAIPSTGDCMACHGGARSPVLGFAALQLGPAVPALVRDGLLANAPAAWASQAPDFDAPDPVEHAARGYLHANCGHCHFDRGVPVPLHLALDVGALPAPLSAAQAGQVLRRASTRNPYVQMPPLGTRDIDPQGLALLNRHLQPLLTQDQP